MLSSRGCASEIFPVNRPVCDQFRDDEKHSDLVIANCHCSIRLKTPDCHPSLCTWLMRLRYCFIVFSGSIPQLMMCPTSGVQPTTFVSNPFNKNS